jgi:hypothetical protein
MEGLTADTNNLDGVSLARAPRPPAEEIHQHEQPDRPPGAASPAGVVVAR